MPQAGPDTAFEELTGRQVDVLALLHRGLGQEQVARRLHVALTTVRTHLHTLCEATGCRDMHELAEWWLDHRLAYVLWAAERAGVSREELAAHLAGDDATR